MIKYKGVSYSNNIEKIECEKETDKFIYTKRGREAKNTEWQCYLNTIDEVKQWLIKLQQDKIDQLSKSLENANVGMRKLLNDLSEQ